MGDTLRFDALRFEVWELRRTVVPLLKQETTPCYIPIRSLLGLIIIENYRDNQPTPCKGDATSWLWYL